MTDKKTVHDVTYDLLRTLGMTTVFGNPGSTEQPFLRTSPTTSPTSWPAGGVRGGDGRRVRPGHRQAGHVNLHTAAGTGNAMGSLVTA